MESSFWHRRWSEESIGFHQVDINRWLIEHWPALGIASGGTVFVPLCGKSLDMMWLREQGHPVLGIELSEKAVAAFFTENGLPFERRETVLGIEYLSSDDGPLVRLVAGDYFALSPDDLADVVALYDRASLIAMNDALRDDYAAQLARIVPAGAVGLLVVIDYDQSRMQGPPFAVSNTMVQALLADAFAPVELHRHAGADRLGNLGKRGLESQTELVYRLQRRARTITEPAAETIP